MKLNGEINLKFDERGLNLNVKNLNINNFCLDKVFKHIEKKHKKKLAKEAKTNKETTTPVVDPNEGYYVIEINV